MTWVRGAYGAWSPDDAVRARRALPREREEEVLRLYREHGRNASATARALGVSPQTVMRICWRHRVFEAGPTGFGAWGVSPPDRETLRRAAARRRKAG